jgi:hypothetical protein
MSRAERKAMIPGAPSIAAVLAIAVAIGSSHAVAQSSTQMATLVEILRPALPFPAADVNGDVPVRGGESAKWFVIWPNADERTVIVRANPLHPDTQAAGTAAMARIQEAVVAAERRAQAAYDRALKDLQRTGKTTNLDTVTLEDEGAAGERIDAELELTIALEQASPFEIGSSRAPEVAAGANGATWTITTPANSYKESQASGARERFRAAEARLVFGDQPKPAVERKGDSDHFAVTFVPSAGTFVIVLRGNEALLAEVLAKADWSRMRRSAP